MPVILLQWVLNCPALSSGEKDLGFSVPRVLSIKVRKRKE